MGNDDFFGTDHFIFSASDGKLIAEAKVEIAVKPVNDAPRLQIMKPVKLSAGKKTSLELEAVDADEDELTYHVSSSGNVSSTVKGSTVTFRSLGEFRGSETVTVTVSDGQMTDSKTVEVSCSLHR